MTRNQFILYGALLVALIVLSELQSSPRSLNISEVWDMIRK
jgi:hypothetical protein